MSDELIFINGKGDIMKRGNGNGQGMLYCGKKYTNNCCCSCLGCDGYCGPDNGCPCPDCDYTLAYTIYNTGEMNCPNCKTLLIRLNIFDLWNLTQKNSFICNICKNNYTNSYIRVFHCMNCDYNICQNCAFSKINSKNINNIPYVICEGLFGGEGMFYCGKRYALNNKCICGTCDGNCGKQNGCPCPICQIILGYNLYLNNDLKCKRCNDGSLLVKTSLIQIRKYKTGYEYGCTCNLCGINYYINYNSILHCYKCSYDICQNCAFNPLKNKQILYPKLPQIKKVNNPIKVEKKEEEKDVEFIKCVICLENNKSYLFMPCKHIPCCKNCAEKVEQCPICRSKIDSKIRIWF